MRLTLETTMQVTADYADYAEEEELGEVRSRFDPLTHWVGAFPFTSSA